ncbi:unnamed protein product [Mytilus coruscus]|uniref:Uncharacterized protein n=1 Tax=Mytilus coruscus TaxID=42192 RepID=A0A6J8D0W8_MYTCO|nr:unnamed protein product [Mytilus coruscus]
MNVVRSGQPVTLINISLYEPETVFRCFNELFHLLTIPALDNLFRNEETGTLKKNWIFVVDNGPSEAPASSLVRMLLVRLVNFLNLDKVLQVSFEKLNSKDNPAERPHASENLALSRHGPFKTKEIFRYPNAKPGSSEHILNMEEMAEEVISCLKTAGKSFFCFRGVKDNYIFDDEKALRTFFKLSEQGKNECVEEYTASKCHLLTELCNKTAASIDLKDNPYQTIYDGFQQQSFTICPMKTDGSLVNGMMKIFLPSRIISHASSICFESPEDILKLLGLLTFVTPSQLNEKFDRTKQSMEKHLKDDQGRPLWRDHDLFKKTNSELESMCREEKLPSSEVSNKLEMIELIARNKKIPFPEPTNSYSGDLNNIPTDMNEITNFSTGFLRTTQEVIFDSKLCTGIDELPNVNQRRYYNERSHIRRNRKFSSVPSVTKNVIEVLDGCNEENLHKIFDPISAWLDNFSAVQQEIDSKRDVSFSNDHKSEINCFEQCKESGSRVKVFWERHELGTTVGKDGWNVGWYSGNVVSYNAERDTLDIEYTKEQGSIYTIEFSSSISSGKLKFVYSPYTKRSKN